MIKITSEGKYPKKEFGEIHLKGGLNNFKQVLKTKYLLPTAEYPTGKAVIELLIPESSHSFSLDKDYIKNLSELNARLGQLTFELEDCELKSTIADQIELNKKFVEIPGDDLNGK